MTEPKHQPTARPVRSHAISKVNRVHPDAISKVPRLPSDDIEEKDSDARRAIALGLVWAYLGIIFLTIVIPVVLYLIGPSPDDTKLSALKELIGPLTAGVSSVTGVIGFVLGYYFKSEEKKDRG